jgi:hypothetical protein
VTLLSIASRALGALSLLALAGLGHAQATATVSEEAHAAEMQKRSQALSREREAVLAAFAAREQACRSRFFVNLCLREVEGPRREALAALRRREVQMEEAERLRRQQAALARIAEKSAAPSSETAPVR